MNIEFPPAHRIARHNYPIRIAAFTFIFLTLAALYIERGRFNAWEMALAVISFLIYPHLAYLHARIAVYSKRAELNNLYADCLLLGAWTAQIQFALWPSIAMLGAICLNSAGHGHLSRLFRSLVLFGAGAGAWGVLTGFEFRPDSGPLVTTLCAVGILAYVSAVGAVVFSQNRYLVRARSTLQQSEQQFRFIADRVGDLVSVLDPQGRILYASPSHAMHFDSEYTRSGSNWLVLVHPGDLKQARSFLDEIAKSFTVKRMHLRLISSKGSMCVVECHGNTVHVGAGDSRLIMLISQLQRSPRLLEESA